MKWNKSVLTALAIGASAGFVLTGCSGGGGGGGESSGGGSSEGYKLAFVQGVAGDEFYISMQCGIEAAAEEAGATVTTQGPEKFDPTLQKPLVDSVVASNPDALLVAPTDVKAMEGPLKAAADAGIKVVLVDTTLEDPSMAVSQIASDNKGGGAAAFEAIKEEHPEGGKVLVVSVDPGISTTDARAEGFQEAAEAESNFEFLGVQYSHNEPATAAEIVTAALQKDPDIVGIFAANLFAAEGTATGVQQAGKQGSVTIVGFDAGPAQVKQLEAGTVQALVAQEPATIGEMGVEQALLALDGKETEEKIQTGFTIITQDNVAGDAKDAIYKSSC
ncbi:ABC transporter substrate-binding protein [Mycetocola miduiensis]|uniref:Monosaccharide ABC transporter substrate-binding protein, CUT2 family n=1 Tax=Mycetocola miduiensis TaxID=995034 RepID=A0A1I4YE15_9MICO|nr:ABC transporter substrate-binding protein [Mycetocola miduiensis]SFN36288.1 monosaccharide ABC transporter substrate-binding protein, CUT2 family [Mycetocola miduiensis]